jgi:hypothetical protein
MEPGEEHSFCSRPKADPLPSEYLPCQQANLLATDENAHRRGSEPACSSSQRVISLRPIRVYVDLFMDMQGRRGYRIAASNERG